jgi:hypothetical protein
MTRRAEIFRSLLPYINVGHYTEWNGYVVFGALSIEEMMDKITSLPEPADPAEDVLRKLISDFVVHGGRTDLAGKVSLNPPPEMKLDAFRYQSPEVIQRVLEMLQSIQPAVESNADQNRGVPDPVGEADSIEAALAEEMLVKLPNAVERASTLDGLNLGNIPIQHLKRYFEEAHRCYLYGFNIACAVLCRAIIETALQNVVDPNGLIKSTLKPQDSYLATLAFEAGRGGILTDDRPQCVLDVRDAGNEAIHPSPSFERKWLPRLGEIVDNTRKILIDLYPNHP